MLKILPQCEKEILEFPEKIREDLADALARLDDGQKLSLPLSRPMSSIEKSVHELRLKDRSGIYRVIYFIERGDDIYLIHGFKKTSQKTPKKNIDLARKRIKSLKNEK